MSSNNQPISQPHVNTPAAARVDAAAPLESSGATKVVRAFMRHWLVLIMLPLLIFAGSPFGYVHFAFLGEESIWAGAASECAAEQDKFWEYHDYLFENWDGENQGTFGKDNLKRFAAELELDTEAFGECVDSGRAEAFVQQDGEFASQLGVRSTPTFAVNGKPVQGALPFAQFQTLIEQELLD